MDGPAHTYYYPETAPVPVGKVQDHMPVYRPWNKVYIRTTGTSGVILLLVEKVSERSGDHRWIGVDSTSRCQLINVAAAEVTHRARPGVRYTDGPVLNAAQKRAVQDDAYRLAVRERGGVLAAGHEAARAAKAVKSRTRALLWIGELVWSGLAFVWTGRAMGFTLATAFFWYRVFK